MSARRRGQGWLPTLLIAGAALVRPLTAQELRGTVRDSASQQPVPGAVLMLLDSAGTSVGRGITNDRGQFRVAMGPTARQVRVQRIGFRPRLVAVPGNLAAGLDITMIPLPSLLEPIQVSDVTKCSRRSDRAAALALWEQVRTGLLATVVAREANPASMRRLLYDRLLDRSGKVQSQSVRLDSAQTDRAFGAALSVAEFLRMGFKSDSGGMDVFYGPDADILLSDGFAAGYCFRIADRDRTRPGQIGLAFGPAERNRDRTDIEGTLWVDSIGRRIVDIDYAYLGLDARVMALHPGGRTSFRTMANGMVVLDRWSIRLVGAGSDSTTSVRNRAVERNPVLQLREVGGEIARAAWPDGTQWTAPLATLRGRATRDGVPAAGMVIHLLETDYAATTDSAGAFEMRELLPGPYEVGVEHEALSRVGLLMPTGVRFTAARDSTETATVPVPSLNEYTWTACGNDPKRRTPRSIVRMLILRVLGRDGRPAVEAKADVRFLRGGATVAHSDVETGSSGMSQVCGIPEPATDVAVFVEREGMAPLEFGARITGILTTISIALPVPR